MSTPTDVHSSDKFDTSQTRQMVDAVRQRHPLESDVDEQYCGADALPLEVSQQRRSSPGNVCTIQRQEADYSDISHVSRTPSPHYESGDIRMYREVMQCNNSISGRGPEVSRANMCLEPNE